VNSYLYEGVDFPKLLEMASEKFPEMRIRYMTSHPKDFSFRLVDVMAEHKNICNSIHLPVQAGSDRVLKMMKRHYNIKDYKNKIEYARKKLSNAVFTSDIMVGFPGETDDEFKCTVKLVKDVMFDDAFTYKYSRRPFSAASYYEEVSDDVKSERLNLLIETVSSVKIKKVMEQIGRNTEVIIERKSKKSESDQLGRDDGGRSVIVKGNAFIGERVNVKITGVSGVTLIGEREEIC